jgi:hypothetical protein
VYHSGDALECRALSAWDLAIALRQCACHVHLTTRARDGYIDEALELGRPGVAPHVIEV